MRDDTKDQIRRVLRQFIENLLIDYRVVPPEHFRRRRKLKDIELAETQPFHEAFFSRTILRASSFERSFSTRLGNTFESCAELIGRERFLESQRNYKLRGNAARAALSAIDSISSDIDRNGMTRSYLELTQIVSTAYSGDFESLQRPITIDLFLKSEDSENYFEMKSPQPNKDQCLGTTTKLLRVHSVRREASPNVRTYYGMPYNPYRNREDYSHSYALKYLDVQHQVLLGEEFWDFVGGPGTYGEVISLYQEVGKEYQDLIETIAPSLE